MAKIAVVNDDPDFIELVAQILAECGHQAFSGHADRSVVDLLGHEQPDVVVLDVMLDRGDSGFNVLTMMRLRKETQHIPVVICTARAPSEIDPLLEKAHQERVSVVYKPFDIDQLTCAIDSALDPRDVANNQTTKR